MSFPTTVHRTPTQLKINIITPREDPKSTRKQPTHSPGCHVKLISNPLELEHPTHEAATTSSTTILLRSWVAEANCVSGRGGVCSRVLAGARVYGSPCLAAGSYNCPQVLTASAGLAGNWTRGGDSHLYLLTWYASATYLYRNSCLPIVAGGHPLPWQPTPVPALAGEYGCIFVLELLH